jgi:hypothetical protein
MPSIQKAFMHALIARFTVDGSGIGNGISRLRLPAWRDGRHSFMHD